MYDVAYVNCQAVMSLHSLDSSCKNLGCERIRIILVYPAGGRRETIQTMRPFIAYSQSSEPRNLGFFRRIEPRNFTVEFVFFPRNLTFFHGMHRNLTFFIRTTIFTENDLKVALLQVC